MSGAFAVLPGWGPSSTPGGGFRKASWLHSRPVRPLCGGFWWVRLELCHGQRLPGPWVPLPRLAGPPAAPAVRSFAAGPAPPWVWPELSGSSFDHLSPGLCEMLIMGGGQPHKHQ